MLSLLQLCNCILFLEFCHIINNMCRARTSTDWECHKTRRRLWIISVDAAADEAAKRGDGTIRGTAEQVTNDKSVASILCYYYNRFNILLSLSQFHKSIPCRYAVCYLWMENSHYINSYNDCNYVTICLSVMSLPQLCNSLLEFCLL